MWFIFFINVSPSLLRPALLSMPETLDSLLRCRQRLYHQFVITMQILVMKVRVEKKIPISSVRSLCVGSKYSNTLFTLLIKLQTMGSSSIKHICLIISFSNIPSHLLLTQRGQKTTKPFHAFGWQTVLSVASKLVYLWHRRLKHRVWILASFDCTSASSDYSSVQKYKTSKQHRKISRTQSESCK